MNMARGSNTKASGAQLLFGTRNASKLDKGVSDQTLLAMLSHIGPELPWVNVEHLDFQEEDYRFAFQGPKIKNQTKDISRTTAVVVNGNDPRGFSLLVVFQDGDYAESYFCALEINEAFPFREEVVDLDTVVLQMNQLYKEFLSAADWEIEAPFVPITRSNIEQQIHQGF